MQPPRHTRRAALFAGTTLASLAAVALPRADAADESTTESTTASTAAVRRGIQWLLRAMRPEGGCGVDIGQPLDIGCSSLAGLALMADGNTPLEGPLSPVVRRIVQQIVRAADAMPADDISAALQTQLQNKVGRHVHSFLACIVLSQAVGETGDADDVRRALRRVAGAISRAQTADGHWGQQSWAPTLGTVLGWVALRAAHFAGVRVDASSDLAARHLARQLEGGLGGASAGWMHTLYKNATGIRVLFALGQEDQPAARQALVESIRLVTSDNTAFAQAGGEEFVAFHLITETLIQKGGADWLAWYPVVRDKLIGVQNADGSWTGAHCITSRSFCTAAALLVLLAPRRLLPISHV